MTAFVAHGGVAHHFAELLIDPTGDGGGDWGSDDWWLHASGTDCAWQGDHDVYDDCAPDGIGWSANNGTTPQDVAEFDIGLDAVGLQVGVPFGLGLRVSNTMNFDALWPDDATVDTPRSWASAMLIP